MNDIEQLKALERRLTTPIAVKMTRIQDTVISDKHDGDPKQIKKALGHFAGLDEAKGIIQAEIKAVIDEMMSGKLAFSN